MGTTRKPFNLKPLGARLNPDAQSVQLVLEIDWTGCSLEQVQQIAAQQIVVNVQNEQRKNWSNFKAGMVLRALALNHVPKGGTLDPVEFLKNMSPAERMEYLKVNGLLNS